VNAFLTPDELQILTGYKQAKRQREQLERMAIAFIFNAEGRPLVSRSFKPIRNPQPDFSNEDTFYCAEKNIQRMLDGAYIVNVAPIYNGPAVYFLYHAEELVYVGKTKQLISRIGQHLDKKFDSFSYLICEEKYLDQFERAAISHFRPKLNLKSV